MKAHIAVTQPSAPVEKVWTVAELSLKQAKREQRQRWAVAIGLLMEDLMRLWRTTFHSREGQFSTTVNRVDGEAPFDLALTFAPGSHARLNLSRLNMPLSAAKASASASTTTVIGLLLPLVRLRASWIAVAMAS